MREQIESVNEEMTKDIFSCLNRLSEKLDCLIINLTSNLAESLMHIRCKFDRGKSGTNAFGALSLQDALGSSKLTVRSCMVPND